MLARGSQHNVALAGLSIWVNQSTSHTRLLRYVNVGTALLCVPHQKKPEVLCCGTLVDFVYVPRAILCMEITCDYQGAQLQVFERYDGHCNSRRGSDKMS